MSSRLGGASEQDLTLETMAAARRADLQVVVLMGERLGPVWVHAPCRVVRIVDAPSRRGFADGTLAGHPERGP